MRGFFRDQWFSWALWAVCLAALASACSRGPEPVEEAVEEPSPLPQLDPHTVQHALAAVQPVVAWKSSPIERVPMSLTAGDGSGLRLVSITGTVVLEDPLAFTELRLTFDNPEDRRREGRFELDLPPDAALSRLAMRVGSRWMEGEVVERTKGRRTFETFIHTRPKVDPALLEKAAANRVSARVFPIQPRERKEIIVSYSQPVVGSDRSYRLPLQGLPTLDALDVRVIVKTADAQTRERFVTASQRVVEVRERSFAPDKDLVVALDGAGDAAGLRTDELVAVRVVPAALDTVDPVEGLTILFDTSASHAKAFDAEVDRLGTLLQSLGDKAVRIVAFDQTRELVHDGAAVDALGDPLAGLRERRAFGASDLHAALSDPLVAGASAGRLLVWSDGVATAGPTEAAALEDAAKAVGAERIDAYASATSSDRGMLATLARAGMHSGFVMGPDLEGGSIAASLEHVGYDGVSVEVAGAKWSYPKSLEGVAPGDDLVVYAGFEEGSPDAVEVSFSDARLARHRIELLEGAAPLIERACAKARVQQLQAQLDRDGDAELRDKLVDLAVRQRLLTRHTSLLVLENEAEYRRYGIDRSALADILTVGPGGVERLRRGTGPTGSALPSAEELLADGSAGQRHAGEEGRMGPVARNTGVLGQLSQESGHFLASPYGAAFAVGNDDEDVWGGLTGTEVGEAYGVGGLGLVGTGRGGGGVAQGTIGLGNVGLIGRGGGGGSGSGYGRGSGAGFGGRGKRVPQVRQAKALVTGALDKDIVRRIVRAHINEIRYCYNQGLVRDPSLAGRVVVQFQIGPAGTVVAAIVAQSTVDSEVVEQCMAKTVKRWKFPKPTGGSSVSVKYPFLLDPGGSSSWQRTASARPRRARSGTRATQGRPSDGPQWVGSAQSGRYAALQRLIADGRTEDARRDAWDWATKEPDNALALVSLGELLELEQRPRLAARVYGSLIDLHPHRADMRRAAGARLEAIGGTSRALALDSYEKAVEQRPDQLNGHRLLAWALAKDGELERAFEVLTEAIDTHVPAGRFAGVKALLAEDRRLIAAAWLADGSDPEVDARLRAAGVRPAAKPSLRLVADWETDATDVDILVDPLGRGRGRRHADVRTGFGPEAWISRGNDRPSAVSARVRYFDKGAMGYAMGMVSSISHDGQGKLTFHDRPFVLMEAVGSVELGRFNA